MRYATDKRLYGTPHHNEMFRLAAVVLTASVVWVLILVGGFLRLQGSDPSLSGAPPAASNMKWPERYSKKVFDQRRSNAEARRIAEDASSTHALQSSAPDSAIDPVQSMSAAD